MFRLEIETDNSAFEASPSELARLCREAARKLDEGQLDGRLYDANGNWVGGFDCAASS